MAMKHRHFGSLGELVGRQYGRGHPQDDEGGLAVVLVVTRMVEVGEQGLVSQVSKADIFPVTRAYSRIAASTSRKFVLRAPAVGVNR